MAVAAVPFIHYELDLEAGDELDDAHPLVALAPHLFVQPEPEPPAKKTSTKKGA
jgi:hypothetical protein